MTEDDLAMTGAAVIIVKLLREIRDMMAEEREARQKYKARLDEVLGLPTEDLPPAEH